MIWSIFIRIIIVTASIFSELIICMVFVVTQWSGTVIHNKLFELVVVAVVVDMSLKHSRDFCNRRISYLIILGFGKILFGNARRIVFAVRIITAFIVRSYAVHQAKTRSPYITAVFKIICRSFIVGGGIARRIELTVKCRMTQHIREQIFRKVCIFCVELIRELLYQRSLAYGCWWKSPASTPVSLILNRCYITLLHRTVFSRCGINGQRQHACSHCQCCTRSTDSH